MELDRLESRCERSEERYHGEAPVMELDEGVFDGSDEYDKEKSRDLSKGRSKDKKKSHREEKDHRSRDRDRSKTSDDLKEREKDVKDSEKDGTSSKEKRREDREEHDKDRTKDKVREKDHERDKHRAKDHDRDKDEKDRARKRDRERERENETESSRGREKENGKEKNKEREKGKEREKEKAKDKDRGKDREREKEKERTRDRDKERDREKNRDRDTSDREQVKDSVREREREVDHDKDRSRDREKGSRSRREDHDRSRDGGKESKAKLESDDKDRDTSKQGKNSVDEGEATKVKQGDFVEDLPAGPSQSKVEIEHQILKMKEERLGRKSESASDILSWVNRSRKLEEKRNLEKEKALQRSRIFEEQDNLDEDDEEDDTAGKATTEALAGVKVLHGLDKVLEGGAVILTLKDQDILANGEINEDVDMLENVEIGEQKRRNDAYKAAKKGTGVYGDKFNDEPGAEKKMLPQYDDPTEEEGVTLAAGGRLTAEAEKKLEELRERLQGSSVKSQAEDLNSSVKISSDYYTSEEMLKLKKPKKKKSLRKKEKLDIDALEAEAISTGLGAADLGSRNDSKRQAAREEQERSEAERRHSAYQAAYAKAEEASKALRMEQGITVARKEEDSPVFADDAEDLQKSLERARKLALKKQNEKAPVGPEAIARLASSVIKSQPTDPQTSTSGEADNKVVFTEMEEFVWGLQLDEEAHKPTHEDVFMEEDEAPNAPEEKMDETGGWTEVADSGKAEESKNEDKEEVVLDQTIHEAPVGKGLAGALKMLKERGTLKETIEWGGRNMDKKKSKLVGIYDEEGPKEIHLERTDEYGRILTPKEAFRLLSHKFHGKGPGKMKLEKRMKQYQDERKLKQMTSSEALPQSVERMREAQAQSKTPYLVLSGNVKPGQTSDPRSGFATVEKEVPGSLTPMLGDKKVEHFLGIKRKDESGSSGTPKKRKP